MLSKRLRVTYFVKNERQRNSLELTAAANFVSQAILEATGSIFTNKVAEGYPGRRYFSGCENIDKLENLAIARAKELFGAAHANLEPYTGSQANQAVYLAVLKPGDRILGMSLGHGGHLSHGAKFTMTGKQYDCHFYQVNPETERLDYDRILTQAQEIQPQLIIAGASSYPRKIDFQRFREIADEVGALLLADIAHITAIAYRCDRVIRFSVSIVAVIYNQFALTISLRLLWIYPRQRSRHFMQLTEN